MHRALLHAAAAACLAGLPAILSAQTIQPLSRSGRLDSTMTLVQLADEDQEVREGFTSVRTDEDRVHLVLRRLAECGARSPQEQFSAALVLQHSPLAVRGNELAALNPDHYLLAHFLAKRALAGGHERARLLVAQSIDRYLSFTQGVQRYGTNRLVDQKTGAIELVRIDRTTTDAERASFGVPPLATLLAQFRERSVPPR
jgi:hypothetical protein